MDTTVENTVVGISTVSVEEMVSVLVVVVPETVSVTAPL